MPISAVEILMDILGITVVGIGLVVPTIDYGLKRRISRYASLIATLVAVALSVGLVVLTVNQQPSVIYNGALKIDTVGAFLVLVASLGAFLVTLGSLKQTEGWTTAPSFFSLLLVITVGVYYLIFVNDLVLLLAAWALVSLAAYALVAVKKDAAALEGASKYALIDVSASTFMLFGIAILVGLTGATTDMNAISQAAVSANLPLTLLALIMLVVGIGFKVGIFPFHGWMPDVYGGVNPITVSFIAAILKVSGVAALLRIIYPFAPFLGDKWLILMPILAIVTMTFGNVAALIQRSVQRMMAYSSIAHVGYMLVGLTAISGVEAAYGVQGVALHLAAYVLATVGVFVALAYLNGKGIKTDLEGLSGLWRRMPVLSTILLILLLSLIGVPPLIGFWSKFVYLFVSPIAAAPWLTLIAIVNTGLSVGYYGQIIKSVFLTQPQNPVEGAKEKLRDPEMVVLILAAALTILLGLGIASYIAPFLTA
jgi:NADH-quinone oxidoreductase subunit N